MGRQFHPSHDNRRHDADRMDGHSEQAWKAMTATDADELDRWTDIEEHLLRVHENDPKRWKYFAK